MSSLFGMNAIELTASSSSSGGGGDGSNSSSSAPELQPLQYQITDFWPVTFVRQIIVMCKYLHDINT